MNTRKPIDELTTKMHNEFSVDSETEKRHTVWTYLSGRDWDTSPMSTYGLTQADIDKHKPSYDALGMKDGQV